MAKKILIVKLSSLGDIVQTFPVLSYLKKKFPDCEIDFAAASSFASFVQSHPLIDEVIGIDLKKLRSSLACLRKKKYEILFDLQGNCKSGLVTFFARAQKKVGFAFGTAREWPNILATTNRYQIDRNQNICHFHLELLKKFFQDPNPLVVDHQALLNVSDQEKEKVENLLQDVRVQKGKKILICPGSMWESKRLEPQAVSDLIHLIQKEYEVSFLFAWGSLKEKEECEAFANFFPNQSIVVEKLPLPSLQYLMSRVDLLIGADSIALHLCATTATPTLSFFGPTSMNVFKPVGERHVGIKAPCPYKVPFEKQCPYLRSCKKPMCTKSLQGKDLFQMLNILPPP